ncbi:hypothetical protein [Paenibacillus sp. 481]|uniref:hypothetical protein n=1 Tax=Paenibacillus sp. 481 TaxID=2835869 RepID=UPI001E58A8F4|nr:hypothetical protein [Paenibacillus sp. 481]UHA72365.1 hypothetical protein KIK04_17005 [Paenibacillus sp. 481]
MELSLISSTLIVLGFLIAFAVIIVVGVRIVCRNKPGMAELVYLGILFVTLLGSVYLSLFGSIDMGNQPLMIAIVFISVYLAYRRKKDCS